MIHQNEKVCKMITYFQVSTVFKYSDCGQEMAPCVVMAQDESVVERACL